MEHAQSCSCGAARVSLAPESSWLYPLVLSAANPRSQVVSPHRIADQGRLDLGHHRLVTDAANDLAVASSPSLTRAATAGLVVLAVTALMLPSMLKGWAPWATVLVVPSGVLGIYLLGLGYFLKRPDKSRDAVVLTGDVATFWVLICAAILVATPRWHAAAADVQPEPTHGRSLEALISTYYDGLEDWLRVEVRQHRSLFPHTWTAVCLLNPDAKSATGAWLPSRVCRPCRIQFLRGRGGRGQREARTIKPA